MNDESSTNFKDERRRPAWQNLVRGVSAQTLGATLSGQVLVLVSGVIAARALGVEDRGYLALFWLGPMTLALIGGLGIPQATTYYIAREPSNARPIVRLVFGATLILSIGLTIAYLVGLLVPGIYSDPDLRWAGLLSAALIPALLAHNLGIAALQGQQRFVAFNIARLIGPLLYAGAITIVFLSGERNLTLIMGVLVGAWTLASLLIWWMLSRNLPASGGAPSTDIREVIRFGVRGVLGSVSPIDDLRLDQLLVGLLVSPAALGLYVVAIAFSNLPRFIARSIGLVAYPRIASAKTRDQAWAIIRRSSKFGLALVSLAVGGLLALVPTLLPFFFGPEFEPAVALAQILLVATFFLSIRRLLTEFCRGLGHPGYGSIGELVSGAILLAAVAILQPDLAETGVAWTVLVAGVISAGIMVYLTLGLRGTGPAPQGDEPPLEPLASDPAPLARTMSE